MKNYPILTGVIILLFSCQKGDIGHSTMCNYTPSASDLAHPKSAQFQAIIDKYVALGLPGMAILVRDKSGRWIGSGGLADIGKNISFEPCTVSKVASITKMLNGTLTHLLAEQKVLSLDDLVDDYLDEEILSEVPNCRGATIRQLMQHTTGIFDIITSTGFYLALLNYPDKHWTGEELIKFAYGQKAGFPLGTSCYYSNTNTLLLSMVLTKATGQPHQVALRNQVLTPLNLTNTYYYSHDKLPPITAQGYYDLYNNQTLVNVTNFNTGSGNGYGGFFSNIFDLQTFIEALLREKTILSAASFDELAKFIAEVDEEDPDNDLYLGPGLMKRFFNQDRSSDRYAYGHTGRDLGYSANCFYYPNQDITCCFVVNYGTNADSVLKEVFFAFQDELTDALF